MNKDNVKSKRTLCALCSLVIVASAALGAWAYYRVNAQREKSESCLFDGWVYGREDQKRASEALVAAGLTDFSWRSGQLFAPNDKRALYHTALANAGAYPKAPSEFRSEALRDMSVFESDAKTRMREMNACILQLERTIEQMRGVEYATVGARSRREQAGLSYKTVITATVGVSLSESSDLNSDFLSAITLATKHQLGVDDVNNISIIDLKSGKSYWGIESSVSTSAEVALNAEKKRIEQYWRDKYMEAFEDVKNIRVSVAADVVWQSDNLDNASFNVRSEGAIRSDLVGEPTPPGLSPSLESQGSLRLAPTWGRFETLIPDNFEFQSDADDNAVDSENLFSNVESIGYFNSRAYAGRTIKSRDNQNSTSAGFARLGNPQRRFARNISDSIDSLTAQEAKGDDASCGGQASLSPPKPLLVKTSIHNDALFSTLPLDGVAKFEGTTQDALSAATLEGGSNDGGITSPIRQTSADLLADSDNTQKSALQEKKVFLRSLNARIAIPRSHIFQVALSKIPQAERSSLRPDSILDNSFYLATEEKYLAETKRFAVDLLRPTSKLYGWTEENLDEWIVVVAYSDATNLEYTGATDNTILSGSRHKAAYASGMDLAADQGGVGDIDSTYASKWEESDVETHDQESLTSNVDVHSTFVTDTDGNLTTVAPTVATLAEGSEALRPDDNVDGLQEQKQAWREKLNASALLAKLRQPDVERNLVVAICVGIAFLLFLLKTTRRRVCRVEEKKEDVSTSVGCSQKDERKILRRSDQQRTRDSETVNYSESSRTGILREDGEYSDWREKGEETYDDELEEELREIANIRSSNRASVSRTPDVTRKDLGMAKNKSGRVGVEEASDYWSKREEALKLIARYPERAAASLQRWVTDSES